MILVLKYLHNFINPIGYTDACMCLLKCIYIPLPGKYLCTSCIQSIVLLPLCGGVCSSNSLLHAITCRLSGFSYTAGSNRIPIQLTQLPPKDLVDHSAMCILHLKAHVSSFKCACHSAIFPMDSSCWCSSRSGNQLLLVGDMIQHDYLQFLFLML